MLLIVKIPRPHAKLCGHIEFVINHVRSLDEDEARQKRANRLNRVDSKMIISSGNDYRAAAQRRLPPFFISLH